MTHGAFFRGFVTSGGQLPHAGGSSSLLPRPFPASGDGVLLTCKWLLAYTLHVG
jgi:hypothetical protein